MASHKMLQWLFYSFGVMKEDEGLRAKIDFDNHMFMLQKIKQYFGMDFFNRKLSVLDLGTGKRFPEAYLFALAGHFVTGLDTAYTVLPNASLFEYYRALKLNGFLDTARCVQLDVVGKRKMYLKKLKNLSKGEGFVEPDNQILFVKGNAENLNEVPNAPFDLVVSKDLFEHVAHPENVAKSVKSLLKPGGCSIHNFHMFTSISGDHNPRWREFESFPVWGHLRNRQKFVAPVYINKLRTNDYVEAFKKVFSSVHFEYSCFLEKDFNQYLSGDVWAEILQNYPDMTKEEVLHDKLSIFVHN